MKVYSYLRVSSRGQVEGDGLERQRTAIAAFCEAGNLELIGEFSEEGVSGTIDGMDRPAFAEMIRQAGITGAKAIVVERMDRLARDLMVSEVLLRECRERDLRIFSADQGALIDMAGDGGDPTRILIRQIMGALAQWEKSNLVKKLRSARLRAYASDKSKILGEVPFGSKDQEEALTLQLIVHLWDAFKHKNSEYARSKAVAAVLNDGGKVSRRGTPFTREGVREIMKNYLRKRGGE